MCVVAWGPTHQYLVGGLAPKSTHMLLRCGSHTTIVFSVVWFPNHRFLCVVVLDPRGGLAPKPPLFVWWFGSQTITSCVVVWEQSHHCCCFVGLAPKPPLVVWWLGSKHTINCVVVLLPNHRGVAVVLGAKPALCALVWPPNHHY